MNIDFNTKVQYLKGVGPKMGVKLNRLGINTVADLFFYYPRSYQDYTSITKIADLQISNDKIQIPNKSQNPRPTADQPQAENFKFQKTTSYQLISTSYTIKGRIVGIANKRTRRRRFTVTEAVVEDGTGSIKVVWFNQPYLIKMLRAGREVILNGKISYDYFSQGLVLESPSRADRPKIVPVYPETEGLSSYFVTRLISNSKFLISNIPEYLPENIIRQNKLLGLKEAIENLHQPDNSEMLERARERIAFNELFLMALRAQLSKVEVKSKIAPKIEIDEKLLKNFTAELPFKLTADQKIAAWKIIGDIKKDQPMNRLLNGDVGSGKTVVAAFAAYVAIRAGYRAVMMAPTEILAQQHFKTCCDLLSKFGISVGLITSSQKHKSQMNNELRIMNNGPENKTHHSSFIIHDSVSNEPSAADLIIGTHALLQDKVELENIGLVIVDEQHRFGVKQRAALLQNPNIKIHPSRPRPSPRSEIPNKFQNSKSKKENPNKASEASKANEPGLFPHFLSMTATPIPRTLYLALFADLDLSVIHEMPKGRKKIKTRVVDEIHREKAYQFIREQIKVGRQGFVICPLIELKTNNSKLKTMEENLSEGRMTARELFDVDRKSVMAEYDKLSKQIFPDLKIGMLHGRMKSKEKDKVMEDFSAGKVDILVSTSVVEVGVDIPNATIMMIEDTERFGLAQLHQFRGRVGRALHQSYCFLFSTTQNPTALSRLKAMEELSDGFKLAEIDLKNRGAGDIFGVMQSGDINLKMASLSDRVLIEKASSAAKDTVADINKYPALKEKIQQSESGRHME